MTERKVMRSGDIGIDKETHYQDILRLAICSDLRRNLLISMIEGKKPLRDLRDGLGISSTTAIHALRELEKSNLVFQDKYKNYALTNIGRITALKLQEFLDAAEVLKKHERYWLEHDLSGIPEHLMEKIGWLKESYIEKAPSTDIFKVYSTFIELLRNAREIRGVSSIFIPDYNILFKDLILNRKIDTKLVLTKEVLDKIDKSIFKEISNTDDLKLGIYLYKQTMRIGFTVTDSALSLGLFDYHGTYDWNNDLISCSKKGTAWGYELFDFYINNSEKLL